MSEVLETRQARVMSLTQRERIKEWVLYGLVVVLLVACVGLGVAYLVATLQGELKRSEADMIAGGKRFIDLSYSLNAASVELDQFRALNMIVDEALQEQEKQRVIKQDLIRRSKEAMMQSRIDWRNAKVTVLSRHNNGVYEVEYLTYLVRNGRAGNPIHLVLYLVPVAKTDALPDGVGVLGWKDFAEEPFIKDDNNDA